ncbi:15-methylpalmitoyl-4-hydroxy-2-pyrone synthase [Parageobacillus thermantarcticus]|uniref:15-methylpalmitoyl-4-hydroxy-2-pyrone synthase n=1 Tax=Parageobacillus thermantarcticus TaxID=186116 RepID=A0A1I0SWD0_9BACL|nr:3-oxoacyl-[acyl-carrier-protein] synthase III C-terminal domain-containing protein [Parageobacillus thermantarcticus]SFA43782.1 15-methylpalmitoyl-4-hydroxy-2-pyrone synthase [Parageobacillus thermantarcticus]
MPAILSVGIAEMPYQVKQEETKRYVKQLFAHSFSCIDRLLNVFENGEIRSRSFVRPLEWYKEKHRFSEKNDVYIESAIQYGCEAVRKCLHHPTFLPKPIAYEEIDAIFYISTTGLATPSIEARMMNVLPFSPHTKRIPIWGLGCAGGAAGIARAYEYCLAFPNAKVLVIAAEFCSLTFQENDHTKSNLIGTSLFSDGVACVCIAGDEAADAGVRPRVIATQSALMPNSEEVMGWKIRDDGLFVVFSKHIPFLIRSWLKSQVQSFLRQHRLSVSDICHFIAHPGGKKVIDAYEEAFGIDKEKTNVSFQVLQEFGNMSSATVYVVLERFMAQPIPPGDYGLLVALGPGFSAEMILFKWE